MKRVTPILWALALTAAATAGASEITGRVTFSGTPPLPPQYDRSSAPTCPKAAPDDDPLRLSASRGVANAVVRILGPVAVADGGFDSVTVTQTGCSYVPRVQAAQKGQPVRVVNGDPLLHNVHAFAGRQGLFNLAQPPGARPVERKLDDADVLRLKCDIHPWMFGWVVYSDNPYFAVTAPDGRFSIPGVPAGKYRLLVWHEILGTREIAITVGRDKLAVDVELLQAAK